MLDPEDLIIDDGLTLTIDGSTSSETPKASPKRSRQKREPTLTYTRFQELYRLKAEVLGRGAYASVHPCVSEVTGIEYAVKVIEKCPSHCRTRVVKEIELFHMCSGQQNIVQLVEFFEEEDVFYLVFEMMHGGPLLNHIQSRGYFTEHEAMLVVRDIATALKFLHDRGIAHRDIKPENILCTSPDTVSPVKLCDLDLASKMNLQMNSITTPELQSPVGSAEFMAPEVVDAFMGEALTYDKRCDIWSLGVILYIMLCGYPPFYGSCWRSDCGWDKGEPCPDCQDSLFANILKSEYGYPAEDWSHISHNARDLIQHLLVKDVNRRYTADDVLRHPWCLLDAPKTPLQTPDVLLRNDSTRDLTQMAQNFAVGQQSQLAVLHECQQSRENPILGTLSNGSDGSNHTKTGSRKPSGDWHFLHADKRRGSILSMSRSSSHSSRGGSVGYKNPVPAVKCQSPIGDVLSVTRRDSCQLTAGKGEAILGRTSDERAPAVRV